MFCFLKRQKFKIKSNNSPGCSLVKNKTVVDVEIKFYVKFFRRNF